MAKERVDPAAAADDEDRGSWYLRSAGTWVFALALWLAALGGVALFSRDGIEVGLARVGGIAGTVTIEDCAHSSSYALCYGPFSAADGSIRKPRLELRTLHRDRPGAAERAWLPGPSATHAWASDVSPWHELLPAAPFALLALIQTVWITMSWRARRRHRRERADTSHRGIARVVTPPPAAGPAVGAAGPAAPAAPLITPSDQRHSHSVAGGTDRRHPGWQDLRGTAAPPGPSIPQQRDRSQSWERPEHG